jgi:hypothetical protein
MPAGVADPWTGSQCRLSLRVTASHWRSLNSLSHGGSLALSSRTWRRTRSACRTSRRWRRTAARKLRADSMLRDMPANVCSRAAVNHTNKYGHPPQATSARRHAAASPEGASLARNPRLPAADGLEPHQEQRGIHREAPGRAGHHRSRTGHPCTPAKTRHHAVAASGGGWLSTMQERDARFLTASSRAGSVERSSVATPALAEGYCAPAAAISMHGIER